MLKQAAEGGGSAGTGRFPWIGIVLALVLLTVVFTWPAVQVLSTHMFGGFRDGPMFLWNFWWGPEALSLGQSPLRTEHLYYPEGVSLVVNTHAVGPSVLTAPLQSVFGLLPAFNLWVLLTFVLSGLGAALLAHELVRDRRAALVAGVAFAFAHQRVSAVMFFNLIQSQFLALFLWALWAALRRRSWGFAAAAGVLGACLLYASYNLLVLTGLAAALVFAAALVCPSVTRRCEPAPANSPASSDGSSRLRVLGVAVVVLGLLVLLGSPLLLELRREIQEHGSYQTLERSASYEESVPLDRYLIRGPLNEVNREVNLQIRQASYLGWAVLLLAVLGSIAHRRRLAVWFWWLVALAFLATSLGPGLELRDGSEPVMPMPFRWVSTWPVVGDVRVAHRYGVVVALALAVLAAYGMAALLARLRARPGLSRIAAIVVPLLIVVDFAQWPFPKLYRLPEPDPAIAAIAADPRDCCVFEYPAGRTGYKPFSYYQTLHQKPIYLDGELARRQKHLAGRQGHSHLRAALGKAFDGQAEPDYINSMRYSLQREVQENRVGWVILAWADYERTVLDGEPVTRERLRAMDRMVRRTLDVEEVTYEVPARRALQWAELRSDEAWSEDCVLGVYKLRLE